MNYATITLMELSLHAISVRAFLDENEALAPLLAQTRHLAPLEAGILREATEWVDTIRERGPGHGMEAFLHTYGLDTTEGVALMCLAEALLRIPDATNADALIHDTFEGKDWRHHLEGGEPWLVNASSWGLLLTGKVVDIPEGAGLAHSLRGYIARAGEPLIRQALRQAMRLIGAQFVLGEDIAEGLANSKPWAKQGCRFSYDILGEGARCDAQAMAYVAAYHEAIGRIGAQAQGMSLFAAPGISVKLSALHPRYSLSQSDRMLDELLPRLKGILHEAKAHRITVAIDAEEANRLDVELQLFTELLRDRAFDGWNGIGFVLQAYQKRAFYVVDYLASFARKHGRVIPLRLVKGAYWDSEIKQAQVMGLPDYPVFTHKPHTDISYLACADKIMRAKECFYPQFATHNARSIASIRALAATYGLGRDDYEFQRLHGMGEALHGLLLASNHSRIYAPIGEHKDLLAYLIRRLLENGANSSFVNLLMDEGTPTGELLADPAKQVRATRAFLAPQAMYGDRKNSAGLDLGYAHLHPTPQPPPGVSPGRMDEQGIGQAIASAHAAFPAWAARPVDERAAILEHAAALIEAHRDPLMALLADEAGKTVMDAVAEIREAADFCRYYALQARRMMVPQALAGPTGESNLLSLHPRGVFGCISPWNFPLAIFTGQVAAALVTGNTALAKPADQTPRIAAYAVKLLHEAGIPADALQLIPATGAMVGKALVPDARVAGIVFTGSVEVAQTINRTLAARPGAIVPFIAETGGQNAMVVDSSALIEQAVDDSIHSAFASAGQRCSALRVLFVQQDIADALLAMLKGAMAELRLGDPRHVSTDIGPVIDARAQAQLLAHIEHMHKEARFIAAAPEPKGYDAPFVRPHAFEIPSLSVLQKEVFGPILHVIRFPVSALRSLPDIINASGYGLTFGLHSRIDEHRTLFTSQIHAGNIYINRGMTGAVVGVQPFGGEGLSGTGPKAGGPHYLMKFVSERTVTTNTAAIGGNLELLSSRR